MHKHSMLPQIPEVIAMVIFAVTETCPPCVVRMFIRVDSSPIREF